MKRFRNILSSGSVSDEPSSATVSQTKKMPKMDTGDGSGRQEELPEEVSLRDVYVQLNNLKRILNQNLDALTSRIDGVCNELKSEVKILKELWWILTSRSRTPGWRSMKLNPIWRPMKQR